MVGSALWRLGSLETFLYLMEGGEEKGGMWTENQPIYRGSRRETENVLRVLSSWFLPPSTPLFFLTSITEFIFYYLFICSFSRCDYIPALEVCLSLHDDNNYCYY